MGEMDKTNIQKPDAAKTKVKKSKVVPAYMNKDKKGSDKKKIGKFVIQSKVTVIMIVVIAILIIAGISALVWYLNTLKWKPFYKYEEEMKTFVFDKVYDNGSAKTGQSVTKSEAVKMALAATYNTSDPTGFTGEPEEDYPNARWVEYAKVKGIIGNNEITRENANDKATYMEVIRYFGNARSLILKKNIDASTKPDLKDFEQYSPDEQNIIADTIVNNLITVQGKKLKGNLHVFKGQVNELVVKYIKKYNTIVPEGEKLNINAEKIPSNAGQYPYTIASVDKTIYEAKLDIKEESNQKMPKDVYIERKELYDQIVDTTQSYYNTLLNIDYNTINKQQFINDTQRCILYSVNEDQIDRYIEYVKKNKITLSGKATTQLPIVYFDGFHYRARVKLEFKVEYSDTKENLLYGDLPLLSMQIPFKVNYNNDEYTVYIDANLNKAGDVDTLYIDETSICDILLENSKEGIMKESAGEEYVYNPKRK